MERKDQVEALIANTDSRWGEESRDFLMGLEDEAYAAVTKEPEAPKAVEAEKPAANAEDKPEAKPETPAPVKINEADLPPEMQRAIKRERTYKAGLVKQLAANARCKFTAEQLTAKDVDELETLAEMVDVKVSYEGRSTAATPEVNDDDEAIEPTPALNWDKPTV